ncbi:UDP-Glycosyltransferase/glycogen phosphorylase [Trametes cingulata]|nr:UDP-Glycosyltransferase/glycogen phosphorylase [Trametes cingulata]
MSGKASKHIVVCPIHLWGHARPLSILVARLIILSAVKVTYFIAAKLLDAAKAEIVRDLGQEQHDATLAARIRFVPIEQGEDPFDTRMYQENVNATWDDLLSGRTITAHSLDGRQCDIDLRGAPLTAVIMDLFSVQSFTAIHKSRETSLTPFKIYVWVAVATDCVLSLFREDRIAQAEASAALHGTSIDEEAHKLMWAPSGRVVQSQCLPAMYDYEFYPQGLQVPPAFSGRIFIRIPRVLQEADGAITFDAAAYHPEATAAFQDWFAETSRRVFYVGPLVAAARSPVQTDEGTGSVREFLDEQLATYGERAVIYISFGSLFWPMDIDKIEAVLDVLMERDFSFVLTRPSPFYTLSEEMKHRLHQYRRAFIADWVPQRAVLDHPATGWCLTHGGHNTVLECVLAGVPMILWPIVMDQATNAVYLTHKLNVAYELLEVRHGTGLGTVYRTGKKPSGTVDAVKAELHGVLDQVFGPDGEDKRTRLRKLSCTLQEAWEAEGPSRQACEGFLDDI